MNPFPDLSAHVEILVPLDGLELLLKGTGFESKIDANNNIQDQINPYSIMQSFFTGSISSCQSIEMEVIDNNNQSSNESHYATLVDIQNINPCSFLNGENPLTKKKCLNPYKLSNTDFYLKNNILIQLYFLALSLIGIYILYKFMLKSQE